MTKPSAGAMRAAERICRQIFPAPLSKYANNQIHLQSAAEAIDQETGLGGLVQALREVADAKCVTDSAANAKTIWALNKLAKAALFKAEGASL